MNVIRRGDEGGRVADVQHRLVLAGVPIPPSEHGEFGPGTEQAVRAFQQARGIIVDGLVGADTWRELVEASWTLGDRMLYLRSPHMRGDDVRALQDRLNTLGFDAGKEDGLFGPRTLKAVQEFQRNYGLPSDGVVGWATVRALQGLPALSGDTPASMLRERMAMRPRPSGLAGMRVLLDPGHGGDDPGNVGASGATEAEVCFDIALRAEAALAAAGAVPFLTRARGTGPDAHARAALANTLEADVFLAIHLGAGDGAGSEANGEPAPGSAIAYHYGHARYRSEMGAHLAEVMLAELAGAGMTGGTSLPKTYPELRETRMPAVVLTLARLADPSDESLVSSPAFRASVAEALVRALHRFATESVEVAAAGA